MWDTWLVMAGRGFGKTRCGSEWVQGMVNKELWAWGGPGHEHEIPDEPVRIALLADNAEDAVKVMIKGRSGLLHVAPPWNRPRFKPSEKAVYWPNGGMAFYYSAEDAEQLRGPEHHAAWCDELAKYRNPVDPWDNLLMGLRLGKRPRALVTTTPRPHPMLKEIAGDNTTELTRGSTYDNRANLPAHFLRKIAELYEGTRVGRQELHAELFDDVEGALFSMRQFDENRMRVMPEGVEVQRIVVAVDPPATSTERANLCGIVVAALGDDRRGYILEDKSLAMATPEMWGRAAVQAYLEHGADLIVGENNQGGEMVEHVVRSVDGNVNYKGVRATRGKVVRAEPASALYEQNRISHVGPPLHFKPLEDQLLLFAPGVVFDPEHSPDRADALVWALTELFNLGEVGDLIIGQYRS
jgi:phage terminase large subunit-like protein